MNVWDELGSSDTEDPSTIKMQSESIDREINNTQLQDGLEPLHTFRPLRPPPPRSFLDPKGDLCVEVGIVPTKCFTVCSRTLARTSLFWNKMLYGEFKESKKACPQDDNLEWIVKLPDDNSTAMGLLLHIAHGLFDVVPSYEDLMNIRDLYEISIITDKYDMTHILQPWARGWLRSITQYVTKLIRPSLREQYCHERLWISWELGDKANFEEIAKVLLLNSTISANDGNGLRCAGVFEPPDIYGEANLLNPSCIFKAFY
ncbi:hypothetical protein F4803DRAFT_331981 [Xylaria telfairii]|nr:hypothetical protein F4803DRAFT_331981 [Xylaria telfairii]